MNIEISQNHFALIQNKIDSGLYPSKEVSLTCAVMLQDMYDKKLASLRDDIKLGMQDFTNGNYSEYNPLEIFQEIEKRKDQ